MGWSCVGTGKVPVHRSTTLRGLVSDCFGYMHPSRKSAAYPLYDWSNSIASLSPGLVSATTLPTEAFITNCPSMHCASYASERGRTCSERCIMSRAHQRAEIIDNAARRPRSQEAEMLCATRYVRTGTRKLCKQNSTRSELQATAV